MAARSRSPTACSRGLFARRNPPSDYGKILQNMVPLRGHMAGKDRRTLLCPCHCRGKHRAYPGRTLSTHSGSQCHLYKGLESLLMSGTPHWETNPLYPCCYIFLESTFKETSGCLCSRGPVSEEELSSQVSWIWALQKPQDRHSRY